MPIDRNYDLHWYFVMQGAKIISNGLKVALLSGSTQTGRTGMRLALQQGHIAQHVADRNFVRIWGKWEFVTPWPMGLAEPVRPPTTN